ncbi:MAG: ATP-binding cassette domain-containing protein [Acidimicrobiales bacterium]
MVKPAGRWQGRGPLRPRELAEAAVLADVTVALIVLGWLLPATTLFILVATLPMAAIAARNRVRAAVLGGLAGTTLGMLIAGTGLASNVASVAVVGALLGVGWRRRWGWIRLVGVGVGLLWPPAALAADSALLVFSRLRRLALNQITNLWNGGKATLTDIGLGWLPRFFDPMVRWVVGHWAIGVPAALLTGILLGVVLGRILVWPPLNSLEQALPSVRPPETEVGSQGEPSGTPESDVGPAPPLGASESVESVPGDPAGISSSRAARSRRRGQRRQVPPGQPDGAVPNPVPVKLVDVGYTYPGMATPALKGVSLTVEPGQFVAVVGANGSGKSTLAHILAGRSPTSGSVLRPGSTAALGAFGGTAMIFQRPETQVLGVRVCDDVVWGLPRHYPVDVHRLLRRVGLDGFAERETSTLSGGELQRLAVASALARAPRLLVSDESTAMVDAEGRELLADLLATLAAEEGIAVVHVTHRRAEALRADRTLFLDGGRLVDALPPLSPPPAFSGARGFGDLVSPGAAHGDATGGTGDDPGTGTIGTGDGHGSGAAPAGDDGKAEGLRLSGVGHVYTPRSPWAHRALAGVDLVVAPGEAVMVLGHNGSGKSTLAWILAGLLVPTEGTARLDGRPIHRQLGRVALSFQHARLQLLRRTVARDIRDASGVDAEGAASALELVGLDPGELASRSVDQLSGGQQRRVALAGMLARRPTVLVLDEPFAGLDDGARAALIAVLARLRAEEQLTLVVVTHDTEGADQLVDRVVTLDSGRISGDRLLSELAGPMPGAGQ